VHQPWPKAGEWGGSDIKNCKVRGWTPRLEASLRWVQLDSGYSGAMEVPPDFFMDVIMEPSTSAVHDLAGVGAYGDEGDSDAPDWKQVLVAYSTHESTARASAQVRINPILDEIVTRHL
jgi:hypothetical protein